MSFQDNQRKAAMAIRGQRFADAASALDAALAERPQDFQSRWLLVRCLEQLRERERATAELAELLRQAVPDESRINPIAEHMRQAGYPLGPVADALETCLASQPRSASLAYNLGWYRAASGNVRAAVEAYERALALGAQGPEEIHLNLANLYMDHLGEPGRAREHLDAALAIRPDYAAAQYNLGNLEEREGRREAAKKAFRRCLELEPGNHRALARLADAHVFERQDDPLIGQMADAARTGTDPDLHYALARALDHLGSYPDAWAALERACELDRASLPGYDHEREEARVSRIIETCDRDWLASFAGDSHPAVMICGIFRSGSTLLERMLGAHPAFTEGGESEFFPRLVSQELGGWPEGIDRITPEAVAQWRERHARQTAGLAAPGTRLTDKRPDNFLVMGLIHAVVPSVRFVVTERDWRDVAVSILATRLGPGQPYATRLEDIRHYLALNRRLVEHWQDVLGDAVLRVNYEDLVRTPRATLGRVLTHLDAPWDDACLAFNRQAGMVATASTWQVRAPLHTRAIGRWRNYAWLFD